MRVTKEIIEEVKEMLADGNSIRGTAKLMNIPESTMFTWYKRYIVNNEPILQHESNLKAYNERRKAEKNKPLIAKSTLKDGQTVDCDKVYKHCIYGVVSGSSGHCDYIGKTHGKMRGCPYKACNKYVKGEPTRVKSFI